MDSPNPLEKYPDLATRKREFARLLLKNPRKASTQAFIVFPEDVGDALYASQHWPSDLEVKSLMASLAEELGADGYLQTKDELSRDILDIAQDERVDPKVRQSYFALYATIQGHIAKEAIKVDVAGPMKELMAKIGDQGRPKPKGAD